MPVVYFFYTGLLLSVDNMQAELVEEDTCKLSYTVASV